MPIRMVWLNKTITYLRHAITHRPVLSGAISLVVVVISVMAYRGFAKADVATTYQFAAAQKGTVVASVSGTGQVSASNQLELKPKASGDVLRINVKNGQQVKAGTLLLYLNAKDALNAVRDANLNLASAKLSLDKLRQPSDALTQIQAENSLQSAKDSLTKLQLSQPIDLAKAQDAVRDADDSIASGYESAFSTVSSSFVDLPDAIGQLDNVLHGNDISLSEITASGSDNVTALVNATLISDRGQFQTMADVAERDYQSARDSYNTSFTAYQNLTRFSDHATIDAVLSQTEETAKYLAQASKSTTALLKSWIDYRTQKTLPVFAKVYSLQSDLDSVASRVNGDVSSLLSAQRTIKNNDQTRVSADRALTTLIHNQPLDFSAAQQSVREREASLARVQAGAEALDLRSQELSVQQRQNALAEAQSHLADYSVRAPQDGIVAKVNVKVGDAASSGTSAITFQTKQKVAIVSLNEVDVAKVKLDQKATLTFDAVDGLSITGQVADIDSSGTVSQGVVSYNVTITFDTQDDRVRPGMSVSASIITDIKSDVLTVPNAAVKSQGGSSYVEVGPEPVQRQTVEVGLSNDSDSEIISGLNEGAQVVVKTITPTTTKTATTAPSLFPTGNTRGLGGATGGVRAGR